MMYKMLSNMPQVYTFHAYSHVLLVTVVIIGVGIAICHGNIADVIMNM